MLNRSMLNRSPRLVRLVRRLPLLAIALLLPSRWVLAEDSVRVVMRETRGGVLIEDLTFKNSLEQYEVAYRICPAAMTKPVPGILYVHWLDSSEPTSNRSQFVGEAVELAKAGACSVLIDTMWSQPDWFNHRDPAKDKRATERQAAKVKSALDFLLASPHVDPARVAFVGHDFGAMTGAILSSDERRVQAWAFQAGTARWFDWYQFGRKLEGEARDKAAAETSDLDPVARVAKAKGTFLFQFGTKDDYVPREVAEAFFKAAPDPKEIHWYEAGHGLNDAAVQDRTAWLKKVLGLTAAKP